MADDDGDVVDDYNIATYARYAGLHHKAAGFAPWRGFAYPWLVRSGTKPVKGSYRICIR